MCVGLDLQGRFKLLWKFNRHGDFPFSPNCSDLSGMVNREEQRQNALEKSRLQLKTDD